MDFQADLVLRCSKIREMMARGFALSDFGPQNIIFEDTDSMDTQELVVYKQKQQQMQKYKKDGYCRV